MMQVGVKRYFVSRGKTYFPPCFAHNPQPWALVSHPSIVHFLRFDLDAFDLDESGFGGGRRIARDKC